MALYQREIEYRPVSECIECGHPDEIDECGLCPSCAAKVSATEIEASLVYTLLEGDTDGLSKLVENAARVSTFQDAGILTRDRGLVLELKDGTEYQITIVKSR